MIIKYDVDMSLDAIVANLNRLTNQIYKLLPSREEGADWERPLETIIEEFAGMSELFINDHTVLFSLLCKLEGLFSLTKEEDFQLYRRVIFDCLNLVAELKQICRIQTT